MAITLRLPYPPALSRYYRRSRNGMLFLCKEGVAYRDAVQAIVLSELGQPPKLRSRLAVQAELIMPDNRARDLDNVQKCLWDALQLAGVFENDAQIDHLVVKRLHVEPPGCVDVVIEELT